jgi:hypothetical protein
VVIVYYRIERGTMKRTISGTLLVLVLVSMLAFTSGVSQVKALDPSTSEPSIQILDFNNGTREMVTDFHNGTQNCIAETYVKKTAELNVTDEANQSLETTLLDPPASQNNVTLSEDPPEFSTTTQTMIMTQPMMFGFTYVLAYWQQQWNQNGGWWIIKWYLTVGIDVDIEFGLRLPVNITLGYPEQMISGSNYTLHATLTPIDEPGFNELDFKFQANVWAQADINVGPINISIPRTVLLGPDIDESKSFKTPLGSGSRAPLSPEIDIDIFDVIRSLQRPDLNAIMNVISKAVTPYLVLQPEFGSDKITAEASAIGAVRVTDGASLYWSKPNQTMEFNVSANDEYDPSTDYAKIILSDFKYYFTYFDVNIKLKFDLVDILNGWPLYWPDPELEIATLDMSWINKYIERLTGTEPYVTTHRGYSQSVSVTLYVARMINPPPPPIPPEDVAISYASAYPPVVFHGQSANVTVGVANLGNVSETFNVTVYADDQIIETQTVTGLPAGNKTRSSFDWNTTGFSPWHTYNITAVASLVPNEFDKDDNSLFVGTVKIIQPPPQANFTYSPVPPIQNQTTTFDASSSISGSGSIANYMWDFGEGVKITTANPIANYVFTYQGRHKVSLTVIDSDGLNDTVLEVVDVLQHDVAVVDVTPYRRWVYQHLSTKINVTITNEGNFTENVTLILYYNMTTNQQIGNKTVGLSPDETRTITFVWDTTGVPYCHNYTITALAKIPFDSNLTNNVLADGKIKVRILGDINGDGVVDIGDVARVAAAFGSYGPNSLYPGCPAASRWNPDADINRDGVVDIMDIALVAHNFGKACL